MKKLVTAVVIAAVFAGACGVSYSLTLNTAEGKTVKELQSEQQAIKKKEQEAEARLKELRAEASTLTNEIEAMDIEIQLTEDQLTYIHGRLDSTNYDLEVTTEELADAELLRENHYEMFKQRLRYIQEHGKIGYVQVLFNSKSMGDFLNRMEYVNDIIEYDQSMYQRLSDIEQDISDKKDKIDAQLREIEVLLMEEEEKMLSLETSREAKGVLLAEIEADEVKFNKQVDELEKESESIAQKIKTAQAAAAAAARNSSSSRGSTGTGVAPSGQYNWPVPGYYRLSSGYTNRVNSITGRREFHTGIDIPAPKNTNIVAADAGTVILAGSNGGYGICVVIDHGNGVSTLYGHNTSLTVSVGDSVTRGQTIAKCGSTGMSTGNHCHFEVRINGSPVAPGPYVGL